MIERNQSQNGDFSSYLGIQMAWQHVMLVCLLLLATKFDKSIETVGISRELLSSC